MTLALGIDIGTSGVRTAVIDTDGTVVSTARAAHLPQDPNAIQAEYWWESVLSCVRAQTTALADLGLNGREISHIAVDGTSGTMVLVDSEANPVGRALMYNSKGFDAEAKRIAQIAPASHITQGSNSALGRAMRLVTEAEGQAKHLLHQADFILARLIGSAGFSDFNNALKTGFDPETERWPDWIGEVIDASILPKPRPVGARLSTVHPDIARVLDLSPNAVVCAGTTDSIAAFAAAAPMDAGTAVTSLGTTLAIKLLSTTRIDAPDIGLYSHKVGNHWLAGGASNTGGGVLLDHFTPDQIASLTELMDPETPTGLSYYPLSQPGERFPVNDPTLAPRLTPRPQEDHVFLQGLFESIARIEAECYAKIKEFGGPSPTRVLTAGGGAQNKVWSAMRSKALGLKIEIADHAEASVGVARLAQQG